MAYTSRRPSRIVVAHSQAAAWASDTLLALPSHKHWDSIYSQTSPCLLRNQGLTRPTIYLYSFAGDLQFVLSFACDSLVSLSFKFDVCVCFAS